MSTIDGSKLPPSIPEPSSSSPPSTVDSTAGLNKLHSKTLDELEKAGASVKESQLKMFGFADEPVPPPPVPSSVWSSQEADAQNLFTKAHALAGMLSKLADAINALQKQPPAATVKLGDDVPAERRNEIAAAVTQYFGVNYVAAINLAFGDLAKVLSLLTEVETQNAITEKKLSLDTMNMEADAIRNAANLRAEMAEQKAWMMIGKAATQLSTAVASAVASGVAYRGSADTPDAQKAAGLKAESWNASIQSTGSAVGSGFDAATEFYNAYYERKIGKEEALRTIYDKLGRSRDAARESAIKAVNDARDLLTQIHREVPRMVKANYDINMRSNA